MRMLVTLLNARTSFSRVMLPAEPVGIGARWETSKELTMFGFKMQQVDRYTLTEKVGDEVKLDVDIVQSAPDQTLVFKEEGVEYSLSSLSMSAQGTVILNLNALEGSAQARGPVRRGIDGEDRRSHRRHREQRRVSAEDQRAARGVEEEGRRNGRGRKEVWDGARVGIR